MIAPAPDRADPPRPAVRVRTLGAPGLALHGEEPPRALLWTKNLALLVYLGRSPERTRTREHLWGLLWGERPESSARHSLNEAIRAIRRAAGDEVIVSEAQRVVLSRERVALDVDELERAVEEGRWEEAAALVRGRFLEGFGVPEASAFEDWVAVERRLWLRRSLHALGGCAEARVLAGDPPGALEAAGRALALDPLSDSAARAGMRVHALLGERAAALELYDTFAERLEAEIGAPPEPETVRLADRVRRERTWTLPEALREEPAAGSRGPMAGREEELERALEGFRGSRERGRAALVLVKGDPGSGRSRLVEELASHARLEGAAVLAIRAVPADRDEPGSGLLALGRAGLIDAPGILAAPAGAFAALARFLPSWAERFPEGGEGAGRAGTGVGGPGGGAPAPLGRAVRALLRAAAEEQPLLLVVDDAQWLDPETADALVAALRDLSRLPFTLALTVPRRRRPEFTDRLESALGRELEGVTITLPPLSRAAIRRLAAAAFPAYEPRQLDRLSRRVERDSAGLPLLATQIIAAARQGLELAEEGSAWPSADRTLEQTLPGELPENARAAIRVNFRRLSKKAQRLLSVAAALPEDRLTLPRLAALAELDERAAAAALDELEWERWLVSDPAGYGFVAGIVREVIATDMLAPGQRARLRAAAQGSE